MLLRWEIIAVFAVSLGASGLYAFISLIGSLTAQASLHSQSVTLNGKPYGSSWVKVSALLDGDAKLAFTMSETPGSAWATAAEDRPPSATATK